MLDTSKVIDASRRILQRMTPWGLYQVAQKFAFLELKKPVINWEGAHFVMWILVEFVLGAAIISKMFRFFLLRFNHFN